MVASLTHALARRRATGWTVGAMFLLALAAPAAQASVVWDAGAERPADQEWASSCAEPSGTVAPPDTTSSRITRSAAVKAKGTRSYDFEVVDGDDCAGERSELAQGNPVRTGWGHLFNEGDDRYISWQVYLPNNFNTGALTQHIIAQWKQLGAVGSPVLSMEVRNGEFRLYRSTTNVDTTGLDLLWSGPAVKNRWVRFTLHVKFAPDLATGFVELWGNPAGGAVVPLLARTPSYTMKIDSNGNTIPSHARIGIYRDTLSLGTEDIYYDGYNVATTRAEAEARAWGHDFGSTLPEGGTLNTDDYLLSANGQYKLIVQLDGNVVLYGPNGALWSTHTLGQNDVRLVMQLDGNLVAYNGNDVPVWSSHTAGSNTRLVVQNDANLVIYDGATPIWDRY